MHEHSIYTYQRYQSFLRDSFERRNLSIRSCANYLGFKAPSYLVMILQDKRKFPVKYLPKVSDFLKLDENESRYLENLISFQHAKSHEEKEIYEKRLKEIHPKSEFKSIDLQNFRLIADPIHYIILEMTNLKGFSENPEWIYEKLGRKYSLGMIKEALERLYQLKLIKNEKGVVLKTHQKFTTVHHPPNLALKQFHKQMIEKASNSIDSQLSNERDITSSTMTINKDKLPQAKELICEFRRKFSRLMESSHGEGSDTYQLNIQFFKLTQSKTNKEKTND